MCDVGRMLSSIGAVVSGRESQQMFAPTFQFCVSDDPLTPEKELKKIMSVHSNSLFSWSHLLLKFSCVCI